MLKQTMKLILVAMSPLFCCAQYSATTVASIRQSIRSAPDSMLGRAYSRLFNEFYAKSVFDSALAVAKEGMRKAQKIHDRRFESTALIWNGMSEYEKGHYEQALELYLGALKIKEEIGDIKGESVVLLNLAGIYYDRNNNDKSKELYLKALDLKKKLNDKRGEGIVYSNLGNLAEIKNKYEEAVSYYQQSKKLAREMNDTEQVAVANRSLANAFLVIGNIKDAEVFAREAYSVLKKKNNRHHIQCLILMGKIYFEKKAYEQSLAYLLEGYNKSRSNNTPFLTKAACFELVKTCAALKHLDQSRFYQGQYFLINDSLQSAKMGEQLADMEVKYETEKKEKAIEHLGKENSEKALELARKREQVLLISGVSLCVLVILITLYFYNVSRKQKQLMEAEKELSAVKQQKQKEIIETILVTEEKARKKIASDLHDGLGQILTAAKINLSNVISEQKDPGILSSVSELINSALRESKAMALNLMPLELKEKGLTESIRNICTRYNKPGTQEISFNTFGVPDKLDPVIEVNSYRICQELLNNAVKYSKASRIFLQLFCRDNKLIIQIEDNGVGFDKSALRQNSLGMNTLKDRVALLKGDMEVDTAPQKGTNIFIELAL